MIWRSDHQASRSIQENSLEMTSKPDIAFPSRSATWGPLSSPNPVECLESICPDPVPFVPAPTASVHEGFACREESRPTSWGCGDSWVIFGCSTPCWSHLRPSDNLPGWERLNIWPRQLLRPSKLPQTLAWKLLLQAAWKWSRFRSIWSWLQKTRTLQPTPTKQARKQQRMIVHKLIVLLLAHCCWLMIVEEWMRGKLTGTTNHSIQLVFRCFLSSLNSFSSSTNLIHPIRRWEERGEERRVKDQLNSVEIEMHSFPPPSPSSNHHHQLYSHLDQILIRSWFDFCSEWVGRDDSFTFSRFPWS